MVEKCAYEFDEPGTLYENYMKLCGLNKIFKRFKTINALRVSFRDTIYNIRIFNIYIVNILNVFPHYFESDLNLNLINYLYLRFYLTFYFLADQIIFLKLI